MYFRASTVFHNVPIFVIGLDVFGIEEFLASIYPNSWFCILCYYSDSVNVYDFAFYAKFVVCVKNVVGIVPIARCFDFAGDECFECFLVHSLTSLRFCFT